METIKDVKKSSVSQAVANNLNSSNEYPLKKTKAGVAYLNEGVAVPSAQTQPIEEEVELQMKRLKTPENPWIQKQIAEESGIQIQRFPFGLINISHDVQLIPQPTRVSCWAAAMAMVISYRDGRSRTPASIAARAFMDLTTGYGWSEIQNAVDEWNLSETPPASAMPNYWADLLEENGPLWIVEVGAPYHAVVLSGIYGTGSLDATQVTVYNPWPPNVGAVEFETFEDFDREFGLGAGAGAMIVHA